MSDSDEAVDGQELAHEEARKLYAIKPDHPLLKYLIEYTDDAVWEEFIEKFGKPGISREAKGAYPAVAYMYAMYFIALRDACKDPEKEITVQHRSAEEQTLLARTPTRAGRTAASDDFDNLPF